MKARVLVVLGLVAACGSLKDAKDSETPPSSIDDAGTPAESDGATSRDAAADDDVAAPDPGSDASSPPCAGGCPVEDIEAVKAAAFTLDKENLYFVDAAVPGGALFQCPKAGCAGKRIRLGSGFPDGIAIAGGNVIWSDLQHSQVLACAIGGCNETPTAIASGETYIRGVWGDGTSVFWYAGGVSPESGATIRSCVGTGNCAPAAVATGLTSFGSLAVSAEGTLVYLDAGIVKACTIGNCTKTSTKTLEKGAKGDVVLANGQAFWVVQAEAGFVKSCPVTGCDAPTVIGGSPSPYAPISDGKNVYWRDKTYSTILRCSVSGCGEKNPERFAVDQDGTARASLAVDGDYLYWTTTTAIRRRRR